MARKAPALIAHGMLSYHSRDILRFFGKRLTKSGQIPRNFHGELQASSKQYEEGERIKFWMDGNSTKAYSKVILADAAVLRSRNNHQQRQRVSYLSARRGRAGG